MSRPMLAAMPPRSAARRFRWSVAALVLAALLGLAGCTHGPGSPQASTPPGQGSAAEAARTLAAALQAGDIAPVTYAGTPGRQAQEAYVTAVSGLGAGPGQDLHPSVTVGQVTAQDSSATAVLHVSWTFRPGATWSYDSSLTLTQAGKAWLPQWAPSVIEPDLTPGGTLTLQHVQADRGDVLDRSGHPIVTLRDVREYGIDKMIAKGSAEASAAKLAALVKINAKQYVAQVKAAGDQAFVTAITYRTTDPDRPSLADLNPIPGARVVDAKQMLAPTRTFARPLLGTVGPATKQIVDASHGAITAGDQTGLSGLEQRYDAQLRGTPALQVVLRTIPQAAAQTPVSPTPLPSPPSPTPAVPDSPSPSASGSQAEAVTRTVWTDPATDGKPLQVTLDAGYQQLAEKLLGSVKPPSALVAIRPTTGEVLAAAVGPGAQGLPIATTGHYPPGSTFKIISSLALLRKGMKPTDKVPCPAKIVVDGRTFTNYSEYPPSKLGTITLADAVAYSCNTAFIGLRTKVTPADLRSAAESLGVGKDYDVGFPAYFGQVPDTSSQTGRAAAMIGQGTVTMSPLAMAQVAASAEAGHTVVAHLVDGHTADPSGPPLTAGEAKQLRELMRGVVTRGSGMGLAGLGTDVGAKTGTAEYGTDNPPKTHAWMIAYDGDLAVAVFVGDGHTGSGTAGPILKSFLQQVHG